MDTILDNVTGLFFEEPTVNALNEAVLKLEESIDNFKPETIRAHAQQFDKSHFIQKMNDLINAHFHKNRDTGVVSRIP